MPKLLKKETQIFIALSYLTSSGCAPRDIFQGRFLFGESSTAIFKINCKKEKKLIFGWYYFDGGFWYTPQNNYKPSLGLRVETLENHIDSNILLLL